MKILRGQISDPTPEQLLWLAVIEQAVREAYAPGKGGDPRRRAEAREWLASADFLEVAVAIGLEPRWARNTIRKLDRIVGAEARAEAPSGFGGPLKGPAVSGGESAPAA